MKLYLASTSKWKSEILNTVHLKHECIESDHEEISDQTDVYKYVQELALNKVLNVKGCIESGIIIGLDTVNYFDGKIIEKPTSIEEAKENVLRCSNRSNSVITGVALINVQTNEVVTSTSETVISFNEITEKDAEYYVKNEPLCLRVSGFVVETIMSNFINKIEGSYYNILGVPVETIYKMLKGLGYTFEDFSQNELIKKQQ